MTALAPRLKEKYFPHEHAYRLREREVEHYVRREHTLLDADCGRTAPALAKFKGRVRRLTGVDVVDFSRVPRAWNC
jgi:tRNA U54 and U55 pseudouridine synthase Pus10